MPGVLGHLLGGQRYLLSFTGSIASKDVFPHSSIGRAFDC